MSTAQQPSRRRRPSASTSGSGYSAAEWERDFRDDMKDSMQMLTQAVQKLTVMVELQGNRIDALESEPRDERARSNTSSARNSVYVMFGALLLSVLTFALQHISFH